MKFNTPNNIVYAESGCVPLTASIRKRQYKFWQKIKDDIGQNPDSQLSKLYFKVIEARLPNIKHYVNLHSRFASANECYQYNIDQEGRIKKELKNLANHDPEGIQ